MMKKNIMMLIFVLTLVMSGCTGSRDKDKTTVQKDGNTIYVYLVEGNKIVKSDNVYQLRQPDSVTASIEEVMTAIVTEFSDSILSYKYMFDEENNVSLELSLSGQFSKEDNLMIMAAVSNTMFQLEGLGSIRITMKTSEGEITEDELFLRDSFYFYDYPKEDKYNKKNVDVYAAVSDGTKLLKVFGEMYSEPNTTIEEQIVLYLAKLGSIPKSTRVNSVSVNAGVCYLDLSADFENYMENVKSELVVYSVVNSITALSGIDAVQIMIDGEIYPYYRKTVDISAPLTFNNELVEQ